MCYFLYNRRVLELEFYYVFLGVEIQVLIFIIYDCCFIFQVLYCEILCNLINIFIDLEEFVKFGKSFGIIIMVDSIFVFLFN